MRKILFYILMLVAFSSCNKGEKATSVSNDGTLPDSLTLRLALLPTLDNLPFYYAETEGIFDSLGIDIRLHTFTAAMNADTAFLGTSADAIVSSLVKSMLWQNNGDSVKAVASTQLNLHLMTAHAARIRKVKSLKEKIIGITRHSAVDMTADQILFENGFVSTDLNKPQINNLKIRMTMTCQNQYDGALMPEPYASLCEVQGAVRLVGTPQLKIGNLSAIIVRDSIANQRPTVLKKLVGGYDLAVERLNQLISASNDSVYAAKHPLRLMQHIPEKHRIDIPDEYVQYTLYSKASQPDDSVIVRVNQWLKGRELIK